MSEAAQRGQGLVDVDRLICVHEIGGDQLSVMMLTALLDFALPHVSSCQLGCNFSTFCMSQNLISVLPKSLL